jgi:hypothetical protein
VHDVPSARDDDHDRREYRGDAGDPAERQDAAGAVGPGLPVIILGIPVQTVLGSHCMSPNAKSVAEI